MKDSKDTERYKNRDILRENKMKEILPFIPYPEEGTVCVRD